MYRQMTLEELLCGDAPLPTLINENTSNTKTYEVDHINPKFINSINVGELIKILINFNHRYDYLRKTPRKDLYYTFYIPKHSGGLRRIDAPQDELMDALRELKKILEDDFGALYHTSAFAYVKGRCTVDAVKRHQQNKSRWFGKFDLSNFFGSVTLPYTLKIFSMIFPFSEIMKDDRGKEELSKALELGFLNGVLPQGTPLSPTLTNIIMIPVDFRLSKALRDFNKQRYVYTRYADDFIISSKYTFKFKDIEWLIINTLREFEAPFYLNREKTRYGSSSGSNWNLGVVLTNDNRISVGHRTKRRFQAMLSSFIIDTTKGKMWSREDVQQLEGYRNYYRMVERDVIDGMVKHISDKYGVNAVKMIKEQLRPQ
jgi:hypothetical protein